MCADMFIRTVVHAECGNRSSCTEVVRIMPSEVQKMMDCAVREENRYILRGHFTDDVRVWFYIGATHRIGIDHPVELVSLTQRYVRMKMSEYKRFDFCACALSTLRLPVCLAKQASTGANRLRFARNGAVAELL